MHYVDDEFFYIKTYTKGDSLIEYYTKIATFNCDSVTYNNVGSPVSSGGLKYTFYYFNIKFPTDSIPLLAAVGKQYSIDTTLCNSLFGVYITLDDYSGNGTSYNPVYNQINNSFNNQIVSVKYFNIDHSYKYYIVEGIINTKFKVNYNSTNLISFIFKYKILAAIPI